MASFGARRERWLVYAMGGGLGHLTRAAALAHAARREGRVIEILSNSPYATHPLVTHSLENDCSLVPIDPTTGRDAVSALVQATLDARRFDVLVVDTFPRGLGGELTDWLEAPTAPHVLIHRDINPDYVRWGKLGAVAARYDLVLVPGESAPWDALPHAVKTAPWLTRDRCDLLDRSKARRILGLPADERPSLIVVGCGRVEEAREAGRIAQEFDQMFGVDAAVRFVSLTPAFDSPILVTHWPLLELMAGVDVLLGAGGYNTVSEARATATPLVAFAQPRRYDRQSERLLPSERVDDAATALRRVTAHLECCRGAPRTVPDYTNGVHEAVRLIESLLRR